MFARFKPGWFVYNMFSIWAYVIALGVAWGRYWLLATFGIDLGDFVTGLLDWNALGWVWIMAIGFAVVTVIGAIGLTISYFAEYGGLELARVEGENGTVLRIRRGLFTTREVNRDDNRMRGVEVSEPLFRLGIADTTVITTGLSLWAMDQPASILPRCPVSVARPRPW